MAQIGNIFNIQHFCVNDGPGIRTVVFLKGCPLDCVWCHNPEGKKSEFELSFSFDKCTKCGKCAAICSENAHTFENGTHHIDRSKCVLCGKCAEECSYSALETVGKGYTVEELMEEISKDDIFFGEDGGITFSGGEPFMQFDFLYECLKSCKQKGYSTCIETSGFTKTDNIVKAAKYTDCFLFDYKETDKKRHIEFVGVDNKLILQNLEVLNELKASVILRCPVIPGYNDRNEHFNGIASIAKKYENILRVEIEPYHNLGERKNVALGGERIEIPIPTEANKNRWLKTISSLTQKKVIFS